MTRQLDLLAIVCALVGIGLWRLWYRRGTRLPLPPGPRGLPIIGNLLDFRGEREWEVARQWGEKYGPVVYAEQFGSKFIFLNTYQAITDLLEKRSSNYSSRPSFVMCDLEGWPEVEAVAMPYTEELKRSRHMLHQFLQPVAVGEYMDIQTRSTHKVLQGLLKSSDKYTEIIYHSAAEIIMMITYGHQVVDLDDPFLKLGAKAVTEFARSQTFFLVNALPWLQYLPSWFPGTEFKKICKEGRQTAMDLLEKPHAMVKRNMMNGTAVPSMTTKLIEANMDEDGVIKNEDLIAKTACVAYTGGADTVVAVMQMFLLAMVLHPEVQMRAQEELDRVVGKNSLPSFSDRPNLPYINAICKECERWQPFAPLALPRTVTKDDEYDGYHLPAGATVLPNVWAVTRDPKVYDDPEKFIPERWLPKEGKEPPLDIYKVVFGFGRRICPGRYLGDNSIFIWIASILSAFSITKALDENGQPITPKEEYTTLIVRRPKPFKYSIKPRSTEMVKVIRQAVESTK